jgi:hypothetical protein
VTTGALFFRYIGKLKSDSSYAEFPFRRRELGGEAALSEEPLETEEPRGRDFAEVKTGGGGAAMAPTEARGSEQLRFTTAAIAEPREEAPKKRRSGWVWIPLSFIFLLLGVILGFQVALSVKTQLPAAAGADPYALHLEVAPSGDASLHVRWDRGAPAIQAATTGILHITDGGHGKQVKLDAIQLRNGSVVYRKATEDVGFRLEVFTGSRVSVTEGAQYRVER